MLWYPNWIFLTLSDKEGLFWTANHAGAVLNNSVVVCVHRIRDHHHRRCQNLRLTRQQVQCGRRRHQTGHPVPHGSVVHLTSATRCKSSQMGVTFGSWFVRRGSRMSVRKTETADSILIIKTVTLQEPADCSDRADLIDVKSVVNAASPSLCFQFLLEVARQKNQTPLPLIKPYTGPRLPPDRYCLTAPNYRLKSIQKKVRHNLSWSSSAFTLSLFVVTNSLFSRCRRLPAGYRCLASVSAPSPAGRPRPRSVSFSFIIMWFINPSIKIRSWMLKA